MRTTHRLVLLAALLSTSALSCRSTSSTNPAAVREGTMAPELAAVAHNGDSIALRSLGKPAVVYFYPKDATPGCTTEACAFRDNWQRYTEAGVLVVGVSADSNESHRAFAEEHELPFPLVADEDLTWAKAFGVGTTMGMTHRVSFLIDETGKIAKVYPDVDPGIHAQEILDDLSTLRSE